MRAPFSLSDQERCAGGATYDEARRLVRLLLEPMLMAFQFLLPNETMPCADHNALFAPIRIVYLFNDAWLPPLSWLSTVDGVFVEAENLVRPRTLTNLA
ncbi:hypothetical protein L284_18050 [Novosphingobium lindaniclasticum LE124]|uniref:Uncharacterized protein n=1 Tax=Novosphingobium lindaniclasticum LE124 TaxID=1096930 RepID=T0IJZ5_9SPHN|nr:hypothetical protein L284_18050 [Novosphingobium lindaniclasticum LE124]